MRSWPSRPKHKALAPSRVPSVGYTPRPESDAVNLETSSGSSSSTSGRRHGRTPVKSSAYSPLLSYWGPFLPSLRNPIFSNAETRPRAAEEQSSALRCCGSFGYIPNH